MYASKPCDVCLACGNTRAKDPQASFHRFPADPEKNVWLREFQLAECQIKSHSRMCAMQAPDWDHIL